WSSSQSWSWPRRPFRWRPTWSSRCGRWLRAAPTTNPRRGAVSTLQAGPDGDGAAGSGRSGPRFATVANAPAGSRLRLQKVFAWKNGLGRAEARGVLLRVVALVLARLDRLPPVAVLAVPLD